MKTRATNGDWYIWIAHEVLARLNLLSKPSEDYDDVILRVMDDLGAEASCRNFYLGTPSVYPAVEGGAALLQSVRPSLGEAICPTYRDPKRLPDKACRTCAAAVCG